MSRIVRSTTDSMSDKRTIKDIAKDRVSRRKKAIYAKISASNSHEVSIDGVIYRSQTVAAKAMKVSTATMSRRINNTDYPTWVKNLK